MLIQEAVNFSARWHGGLCASPCDGDAGGSACKAGGGSGSAAFHEPYCECSVEAITGANRIDGFDRERAHPFAMAITGCHVGSFGASLEHDALNAAREQVCRGFFHA